MQWKICSVCGKSRTTFIQYKDRKIVCFKCAVNRVGTVLLAWLELIHKSYFKSNSNFKSEKDMIDNG